MEKTVQEKIKIGQEHKDKGNDHFKKAEFKEALQNYHTAILYVKGLDTSAFDSFRTSTDTRTGSSQGETEEIQALLCAVHSNMAAVYLKLDQPEKAAKSCDLVLKIDENNAKALFRKALASKAQGKLTSAKDFLSRALKIAPQDKGIRDEMQTILQNEKEANLKSTAELKKNLAKGFSE